jgi:hypothetical protein
MLLVKILFFQQQPGAAAQKLLYQPENLNESSGCLIISNDENISLPASGKTNAYDIDFDKPCFFVNNHYISPVKKCYNVKLPNPVSLEWCDKLRINIKLPINILGESYGYSIEDLAKLLRGSDDFCAGLRLKSADGCIDITRRASEDNQLEIEEYCGWINIIIHYEVGEIDSNRQEICNLCEIGYSLCFEPVKLKTLYGSCHGGADEIAEFRSETCLEIENVAATRQASFSGTTIVGPENFLCIEVVDVTGSPTASFDKFNKTLTLSIDSSAGAVEADINTVLPTDFSATSGVSAPVDSLLYGTQQTTYTPKP